MFEDLSAFNKVSSGVFTEMNLTFQMMCDKIFFFVNVKRHDSTTILGSWFDFLFCLLLERYFILLFGSIVFLDFDFLFILIFFHSIHLCNVLFIIVDALIGNGNILDWLRIYLLVGSYIEDVEGIEDFHTHSDAGRNLHIDGCESFEFHFDFDGNNDHLDAQQQDKLLAGHFH